MVLIFVPLLLTGCAKGLFGGESNVLRPEIIHYKGTTDKPKPPAKKFCPEPDAAEQQGGKEEKVLSEKPCPPVEKKLLPQELPAQSPDQLMPIPPPAPPKPSEKPQSGPAAPVRRLAVRATPDFSYRDASLTEDVAWHGEVHIAGVVTVAPQATLTVEPGTVIRFGGGDRSGQPAFLLVYGRMVAKGTREKPVLFTSHFTQPMAGDWQGVALMGSEKKNLLEHCRMEGAETGLDAFYSTIHLKNVQFNGCVTGARLRDSVVTLNSGGARGCIVGLHLVDSEADLHDTDVSGNRQGVVADKSSVSITGGNFGHNDLDALKAEDSRVKVAGGNFRANGAGLTMLSSQGSVSGVKITGNVDYGIRLANSRVKVFANEIARNGGVGIRVEDGKGAAWGNAILENGGYDLVNGGTEEFKAMGNWWGGLDPSAIGNRIYQKQSNTGHGRVFYIPYLKGNPLSHL